MKILVAGDWASELHERAVADAFVHLGHDVRAFPWHSYFRPATRFGSLWGRVQNKFLAGPALSRLNNELGVIAEDWQPDLIFIYRGTHVRAETLAYIRDAVPKSILIGYNNDDPFAAGHPPWLWRHFIAGLPHYDLVCAYRHHNIEDYLAHGAKRSRLLRSWYLPAQHRPPTEMEESRVSRTSLIFIGHFEDDGRIDYLDALFSAGIEFELFGPEWHRAPPRPWLSRMGSIQAVRGSDYTSTLWQAKIALCFLSRLNRDSYTRRCFEIPATGTMMLSEYTDDLASLYADGVDAVFFRSPQELVAHARHFLANDAARAQIARSGLERVRRDGHDVVSRMKQVLQWAEELRNEKQ